MKVKYSYVNVRIQIRSCILLTPQFLFHLFYIYGLDPVQFPLILVQMIQGRLEERELPRGSLERLHSSARMPEWAESQPGELYYLGFDYVE